MALGFANAFLPGPACHGPGICSCEKRHIKLLSLSHGSLATSLLTLRHTNEITLSFQISILLLYVGFPCLIFTALVRSISLDNLSTFGAMILCAALLIIMGALIGVANLFCFVLGVPSLKREVFWTTIRTPCPLLTASFTSIHFHGKLGQSPVGRSLCHGLESVFRTRQRGGHSVCHLKIILIVCITACSLIVSFIGICNIYFFTVGHIGTEKDSLSSKEREATLSVDPDSSLPLTQTLPESDADADPAPRSKFCQSPVVTTLLRKYHQISDPVSRAIHKTPSRRMAWDALTHPATLSVICGWTFALITPVRRLFVPQDEDGSAPLGFFLETLSFVGTPRVYHPFTCRELCRSAWTD